MIDKKELFFNKKCKLEKKSGFFLIGIVKDIDEIGIIFETVQSTSFVSWDEIKELLLLNGGNKP